MTPTMNAVPKVEPDRKPIAIWIWVSTEDQARGESPEHHKRRTRAYAEGKGWKVREVYHLEGVSGKSVIEHPEAQRMLKDIRSGHSTRLVFSKLARLARNTKELLELSDIFREPWVPGRRGWHERLAMHMGAGPPTGARPEKHAAHRPVGC